MHCFCQRVKISSNATKNSGFHGNCLFQMEQLHRKYSAVLSWFLYHLFELEKMAAQIIEVLRCVMWNSEELQLGHRILGGGPPYGVLHMTKLFWSSAFLLILTEQMSWVSKKDKGIGQKQEKKVQLKKLSYPTHKIWNKMDDHTVIHVFDAQFLYFPSRWHVKCLNDTVYQGWNTPVYSQMLHR